MNSGSVLLAVHPANVDHNIARSAIETVVLCLTPPRMNFLRRGRPLVSVRSSCCSDTESQCRLLISSFLSFPV